jgi:D-sedoheptulose 7-phosphate isomerase
MQRGIEHIRELRHALRSLERDAPRLEQWGRQLAATLVAGRRLLVAGNGGSAAEAQHLTAELVGRYCTDRRPFSAIALHAETSSVTAIANDYAYDEVFARQVRAHGRPGDRFLALTTSGRSANVVHACRAARECGLSVWAVTGAAPNLTAELADDVVAVDAPGPAVQEVHLVAVHLLCAAVDAFVAEEQCAFADLS